MQRGIEINNHRDRVTQRGTQKEIGRQRDRRNKNKGTKRQRNIDTKTQAGRDRHVVK